MLLIVRPVLAYQCGHGLYFPFSPGGGGAGLPRRCVKVCLLLSNFRSCRRMGTVPPGPFSAPSISSKVRGRFVCQESDSELESTLASGDGWKGDAGRGGGEATSPWDSMGIQSMIWPSGWMVVLTILRLAVLFMKY